MEIITFVKLDSADQQGNQLMGKNGKPYTRQTLKVASKGDKYISGFLNESTKGFAIGDEVDIVITESDKKDKNGNPYLNWSLPKKGSIDAKLLQDIFINTESILNRLTGLKLTLDALDARIAPTTKASTYPQESSDTAFDDFSNETPF